VLNTVSKLNYGWVVYDIFVRNRKFDVLLQRRVLTRHQRVDKCILPVDCWFVSSFKIMKLRFSMKILQKIRWYDSPPMFSRKQLVVCVVNFLCQLSATPPKIWWSNQLDIGVTAILQQTQ
jgi:hypothetical protein